MLIIIFSNKLYMKLYRAVPKEGFEPNKVYHSQATRRPPSNVPYLADNVWEHFRPQCMPSRRFSIFASPTPRLALQNASSNAAARSDYVVCELTFSGPVKVAHLLVEDARYHGEIAKIQRCVMEHLGREFATLSLAEKQKHAALFMPCSSQAELSEYFTASDSNKALERKLAEIVKFWYDARSTPEEHTGELFFEITPEVTYCLKAVEERP